ncbi:hypothetical protein [Streptomyces sp. HNA39]|uniref:hypothetical protein n=1 Tax=Streptomyces sp. HNA39 TaxID=2850561 RepID=UPI00200F7AD1|nr:hypothetical protein [Streptomyces sp. HNA39]UQA37343.1 hypothetical protein KRR37_29190 [Streptomyces sp. HNA39]
MSEGLLAAIVQPAEAGRECEAVRVLLRRGVDVLPPTQREQRASGLILAFTLTGLEAEGRRLRSEGVEVAMPLREEPWGRRIFVADLVAAGYAARDESLHEQNGGPDRAR